MALRDRRIRVALSRNLEDASHCRVAISSGRTSRRICCFRRSEHCDCRNTSLERKAPSPSRTSLITPYRNRGGAITIDKDVLRPAVAARLRQAISGRGHDDGQPVAHCVLIQIGTPLLLARNADRGRQVLDGNAFGWVSSATVVAGEGFGRVLTRRLRNTGRLHSGTC